MHMSSLLIIPEDEEFHNVTFNRKISIYLYFFLYFNEPLMHKRTSLLPHMSFVSVRI